MATPTGPRGVNSTIRVDLDDSRLVAAMDRLEGRFANSTKAMVSSMSKLRKAVDADFTGIGRDSSKTGDIIAKSIESGFDRVIAASHKGEKAMSSFTKSSKDDLGTLTVQIRHTAEAMALYTKRVEELGRANDAAFNRADTARANVAAQTRQQQYRLAAQAIIEDEKRVTESLRFEQRRQLETLRTNDSLTRIREQASQQKRLALWQTFYRTIGQFTENFARQIGEGAGAGLRRLLTREKSELGQREGLWRRSGQELQNIEEQSQRSRLNILGRFFDQRRALMSSRLAEESRLQGGAATGALSNQLNTGVVGSALNATPLGYLGAGAAGASLVGGLVAAFKVSSDFSSSLAVLEKAAGASADQIERVRKASIELGRDADLPGLSAADAADAFRILAVSGIDVETALGGAARATLQLSRASKVEATDAAKSVASGINVFGLAGDKAQVVADGLAVALTQSGASLSEMNDAIKQAGLSFASKFVEVDGAEKSFNNLNATLAIFAKNGLRGSDAGTSLKTMLQFLSGKSVDAQVRLEELTASTGRTGTVLFDAAGKTRSFAETIKILREGINKLPTDQDKAEFISKVFGTDASRATEVLAALNDEALPKLVTQMGKSGSAADLAKAQYTGWKRGIDALQGTIETIGLTFERLGNLAGLGFEKLSNFIAALAAGEGVLGPIRNGLLGVGAALGVIVAVKGASEVFTLIRTAAMALSASPLGLLAVTLAAVGGAVGVLVSKNPQFVSSLKETAKGLLETVNPGRIFSEVFETISGVVGRLTTVVIPAAVSGVRDFISGLSSADATGPASFFVSLGRTAANSFGIVVQTLTNVRDALLSGFDGLTSSSGVLGAVQTLGNLLSGATVAARTFAEDIGRIFNSDASFGTKLLESVRTIIPSIKTGLLSLPDEVSGPILSALSKVGEFLDSAVVPISNTVEKIRGIWRGAFGEGSIGERNGILAGLGNLLNTLTKMLGRTLTAMVTDPTLLKTLATVMAAAAAIAIPAIQGFIQGVVEKLIDRFQSMLREIPIFGGLLAGIGGVAKSMSGILTAALIAAFAWSKLKGPVGQFTSRASKSFQGLKVLSAGGALTADDRKAYTAAGTEAKNAVSRRLQAAADAAGEKPGSNGPSVLTAALRSKENIALIKEEQRAVLERQFGAQKASRIIQQAAADEAAATRRTAKTTEDAARAQNLSRYDIAGNLLNAKLGFDEATASVKKFYGTISDGSLLAKAKRALATVTGTRGLATRSNDALERLRTNNELDRLKAIGRSDRTPEQNARFASLQATLGPTTVPQRLQDAGAEVRNAAAARLRQRELDAAQQRTVRSLEVAKLPGVSGLPGATAAIEAMRSKFRTVGTELATLDTKGSGVWGRMGVGISKVAIIAADTAERFGKLGLGEAIENFGRKFAGLDPLVTSQTDGIANKIRGMADKVKVGVALVADNVREKFKQAFGPDGNGAQALVSAAEIAVGGFLSGKTIASSSGLEGKLIGVAGAVGSIAAGFAVGGPLGAGLAAVTTAVGFITSKLDSAREKQEAWTAAIDGSAKAMLDARLQGGIEGSNAAAQEFATNFAKENSKSLDAATKKLPGLTQIVLDALTEAGTNGDTEKAVTVLRERIQKSFKYKKVLVGDDLDQLVADAAIAGTPGSQTRKDFVSNDLETVTVKTREAAERVRDGLQKAIRDGVSKGTVDATHLYDKFLIEAKDGNYTLTQQTADFGSANAAIFEKISDALVTQSESQQVLSGEVGKTLLKREEERKAVEGVGDALTVVTEKTSFAAKLADNLTQKFAAAADAAAGIDPNSKDPVAEAIAKGGGGGADAGAKSLKALYDAAKPVREAIRGVADALTTTDEAGNKVKVSLADALSGKLGSEMRDKVTEAQSNLNEAFAAWAASAAKDPAIAANWAELGTGFLEKMRQAMLDSATEAGGADFGQQIINSLNVPDAFTVKTALASATQEEIEAQVAETKGHMQAVWDKNKIVLKFDAQPSAETIAALKALGLTVLGPDGKPILGGDGVGRGVQVPNRNPDSRSVPTAGGSVGTAGRTLGDVLFGGKSNSGGITYDSVTRQIKEDVKSLPAFSGWTANENRIGLPVFYQQKIGELQANPSSGARIDLVNKMFEVGHRFPYFAQGDVVNKPTVGVFGEAGPEVIVPLSKPKRMIQLLSKALSMTGHLTGMLPQFAQGAIVGGKGGGTPRFQQGLYRKLTEKMPMDQLLRLLDFNVNTYASTAFALTRSPADRALGARVLDARRPVTFTVGDLVSKTRDWSEREFDYVRPTIRRARDVLQSTEGIAAWASAMLTTPAPNRRDRKAGGWNKALGSLNTGKVGGMPKFADGAIFGGGMPSPVPMGNQAQASSDRDTMGALLEELRMMRQASAYNETNNYNIHGQSDPHGTALATMAERKADRYRSGKGRR